MTECKEASDGKHIGAVVHQDEEEAAAKIERWKSRVVFQNEMQKHGNLFHLKVISTYEVNPYVELQV